MRPRPRRNYKLQSPSVSECLSSTIVKNDKPDHSSDVRMSDSIEISFKFSLILKPQSTCCSPPNYNLLLNRSNSAFSLKHVTRSAKIIKMCISATRPLLRLLLIFQKCYHHCDPRSRGLSGEQNQSLASPLSQPRLGKGCRKHSCAHFTPSLTCSPECPAN